MISHTMNQYFSSADAAFDYILRELRCSGELVSARGSSQKEVLFMEIGLHSPTNCIVQNRRRKFKPLYAVAEFLWYVSGSRSSLNIGKVAKVWDNISDENNEVESNYGSILFNETDAGSPWRKVVDELKKDQFSRRAVMSVYSHANSTCNTKDVPCTLALQFFIRNNLLHCKVNMRSNDVVFGFCNDVFAFSLMQQMMLNELLASYPDLKLGWYVHSVGSMHIYEDKFHLLASEPKKFTHEPEYIRLRPGWTLDALRRKWSLPEEGISKDEIYQHSYNALQEVFDTNIKPKWHL